MIISMVLTPSMSWDIIPMTLRILRVLGGLPHFFTLPVIDRNVENLEIMGEHNLILDFVFIFLQGVPIE